MHIYTISETTGKYSSEEHIVIAESVEDALAIVNGELRPESKMVTPDDCQDWGEVTPGWKGSISTGDN